MAEYEEIVKSAYQSAVELRNAVESLPGMDDQQQSEGVLLTIGWGGLCLEHARCAIWSAMAGNTRSAAAHLRPMEDAVIGTVWASEARDAELKHADGAINDLVESGRTEPPAEWSETGRAVWAGVLKEILQEKEDDRTRKGGLSSFMHAGSKGVGYAWSNDGFGDEWIKAAVGGRLAGRVHRAQSAAAAVMVMAAGGNPQATLAVLAEICKQDRNILRLNRPVAGEPGLRRKLSTLQNETRSLGMEVILREEILKLAGRTTAEPTSGKAEHLLEEVAQKQAEIRLKEVEGYRLVTSGTWSIQHLSSQPYDAARMFSMLALEHCETMADNAAAGEARSAWMMARLVYRSTRKAVWWAGHPISTFDNGKKEWKHQKSGDWRMDSRISGGYRRDLLKVWDSIRNKRRLSKARMRWMNSLAHSKEAAIRATGTITGFGRGAAERVRKARCAREAAEFAAEQAAAVARATDAVMRTGPESKVLINHVANTAGAACRVIAKAETRWAGAASKRARTSTGTEDEGGKKPKQRKTTGR